MSVISILANLVLIGAIQGLVISCLLLFSRSDQPIRPRALAGFLAVLAYDNLDTYFTFYLEQPFFVFDHLSCTIPYAAGPFLYVYASTHWRKEWPQPIWSYFIPFFILLTIRLSIALQLNPWSGVPNTLLHLDLYHLAYEPLLMFMVGYYMLKIRYEYRKAEVEPGLETWMRDFIRISGVAVVVVFLLLMATWMITWFSTNESLLNVVFAIGVLLSCWVYWLAFFGYQRTKVIFIETQRNEQIYWNSLSEAEIEHCLNQLRQAFQEHKCYLDPELSLSKLAQRLNLSPKCISAVLNQKIGMGFNEYLNRFRVEAVKEKLLDPSNAHLNITGVALEAGFNSIATFQRAFKQHTGQTPSEFLQKSLLKSRIE